MRIAIPSAHRADKRARSLEQLLELENVPAAEIVFYVPGDQALDYRRFLPGWISVYGVGDCIHVNTARNAILTDHMGGDIVIMEDDVPWYTGSRHCFAPTRYQSPPSSPRLHVLDVASIGFAALDAHGLTAWGIYPVAYSGTALKPRVGVGTLFLVGHTVGLRLSSREAVERYRLELPLKEDYELSALAVEHAGAVVRLDCIAPFSTSGKGTGGTNVYRERRIEADCARHLLDRWPNIFQPKTSERNGLAQVAMVGEVQWFHVEPEKGWWPYGESR